MCTQRQRSACGDAAHDLVPPRPAGASEEQIRAVLGYVPVIARRYQGLGLALDELIAAGNLGVVEAAVRFDPTRKVKFISYADWWIRKAVIDGLGEQAGPLRLPRYQMDKLRRIKTARAEWLRSNHEEPGLEQLCEAAALPMRDVIRLLQHLRGALSIEEPGRASEDRPIGEMLADRGTEGPLRSAIRRQLTDRVRSRVVRLAPRERDVLDRRFGLDGRQPRTLRQTGRELGISRERVRQIELRALLRLRDVL